MLFVYFSRVLFFQLFLLGETQLSSKDLKITSEVMLLISNSFGYRIRCWIEIHPHEPSPDEILEILYNKIVTHVQDLPARLSTFQLAKNLLTTFNMNACEVINKAGHGFVMYSNWP